MLEVARQFGNALDGDDFETTRSLIHPQCQYIIGEDILIGPDAIASSYEQNMLEGRKKMDDLTWGKSRVEALVDGSFKVHFTDYLTHKGQKYTHRCAQVLQIDAAGKINRITHLDNPVESKKLEEFYQKVGILPND